jgi:polar amino acid transport system substrate-binding protein
LFAWFFLRVVAQVLVCSRGDRAWAAGWFRRLCVSAMLLCLAAPAGAASLSVCISDEAFAPFTDPQRDGESQKRIRLASKHQGWQVKFVALPWRRCLAGVQQDIYDAVAGVAATAQYQDYMAFPQRDGQVDGARALGVTRLVVYRPVGSAAGWNGQRFSPLVKPVLYLSGRAALKGLLARMQEPADDTAKTSTQLALMLLKGRGSLAIDHDYQVAQLLSMPAFQGRLEVLPAPFGDAPVYMAVGWHRYERNRQLIEAIWSELGALQQAAGPTPEPIWPEPVRTVATGSR